jgi:hypothetical protein
MKSIDSPELKPEQLKEFPSYIAQPRDEAVALMMRTLAERVAIERPQHDSLEKQLKRSFAFLAVAVVLLLAHVGAFLGRSVGAPCAASSQNQTVLVETIPRTALAPTSGQLPPSANPLLGARVQGRLAADDPLPPSKPLPSCFITEIVKK